ncbi:MAG: Hsp20/alpha crystallin family protein [Lachnospiraceae bacterium]|nr:Hsp20/alpha crystallin family protein [Lachnospiraceae bacterium]
MLVPSIFGENLLDGFFDDDWMRPGRGGRPAPIPHNLVMKTDIKETDGGFELAIELPGYKKDDVQAELKDGYMTISASQKEEKDEKDGDGKYIRRERFYGNCSRSFYVGENVDETDIEANFENGVLKVFVPKKEPVPEVPEKKLIQITGE